MKFVTSRLAFAAALASAVCLAACGGGGGDATPVPPATSQVPSSASDSIYGFISYLKDLVASSADLLDPVDISTVRPPTDDTSVPDPSV